MDINEYLKVQKTKPRDSQRKRVYRWESALIQQYRITATLSLEDCEALVRQICADYNRTMPSVEDGRGRRSACYKHSAHSICLPKWTRSRWYVCHEVAHSFFSRNSRIEPHGPEFMATHINLLAKYARDEIKMSADGMRASAIDSGLRVAEL